MTALSALKTALIQDYTRDKNYRVFSEPAVERAINKGYRKVQRDTNFGLQENQKSVNQDTTADIAYYELPSDFVRLIQLQYDDVELSQTTREEILETYKGTETGKPTHYYLYANKIWLFPTPDEVKNIDIEYVGYLDALSDSQGSLLVDDFDDAILAYAGYKLFVSVDEAKANRLINSYQREIASLGARVQSDDNLSFTYRR